MQPQSRNRTSENILFWIVYVFLFTEVLSGLLRHAFVILSLEFMIYIPKFILVIVIFYKIARSILLKRFERVFFTGLVLTAFQMGIGLLYTENVMQVAFGVWVLVPLIFGLMIYSNASRYWDNISYKPLLFLWAIAITGIFLQSVLSFSWEGLRYSFVGTSIVANKLSWIFGIQRLSGFSRTYTEAAAGIMLMGVILQSKLRGFKWYCVITVLGGVAIWLTTSRIWFIAWMISSLFYILNGGMPVQIKRIFPFVMTLTGIFLPLFSFFLAPEFERMSFFYSLGDRLTRMWPRAFDLVFNQGNIFFGRGIGGIGTAQKYYEATLYNSGDNLFLVAYAVFGILGLLILLAFSLKLGNLAQASSGSFSRVIYFIGLAILLHGQTANGLESSFSTLSLGVCLGYIFSGFDQLTVKTRSARP